ncbi:MAG: diguanylate cyclase [Chloroflexi bacterium]|nr:diguanylate cyclase [Chloroflexota bacterium]
MVEDARADERFAALACTWEVGIGAYTGVPLYWGDGRLFGTLCTLHPDPRTPASGEVALMALAGRVIMQALEAEAARQHRWQSARHALLASERRYGSLVELSPDAVLLTGPDGTLLMANPVAAAMFGYGGADAMLGQGLRDLVAAGDWPDTLLRLRTAAAGQTVRNLACALRRSDGSTFPAEVSVTVLAREDAVPEAWLIVARDVTERKALEARLEHQALHDSLTGLPNRTLLRDRLEQALHRARRQGTPFALLLLDLDRFKEVNDTFGHHYGDLLLRQLGGRLRGVVRESDTVGRLGGDEFAVVLPDTDAQGAVAAARKVRKALRPRFVLDGHGVDGGPASASSCTPSTGRTPRRSCGGPTSPCTRPSARPPASPSTRRPPTRTARSACG